jgi:hypothetical protein
MIIDVLESAIPAKKRPERTTIVSPDEIMEGPIMKSLALGVPELKWFKSLLYDKIDSEAEKDAFVSEFRTLIDQDLVFKTQMIEAIRDFDEETAKDLLKGLFTQFLKARHIDPKPDSSFAQDQ